MSKISDKLNESILVKRYVLVLWSLAGFGCGCVLMFMFSLLALV